MRFDPSAYGEEVAGILALDGAGERLVPLAMGRCSSPEGLARMRASSASRMFPSAAHPDAAMAGLYLYFSCLDEAHEIAQRVGSAEGSYWHAVMHRQEPDAGNSAYWFRRVGRHPIFPALRERAVTIAARCGLTVPDPWDPMVFIDWCERALREPGSEMEKAALEVQRAEWQLLFDHCARPR